MNLGYVTTSVDLVGQDFCKWHFTQLCQGYRQFCLLTYAHSGFVPKTKILEETSRRPDEQTNRKTDETYWQQFQLVKIFANDTLPSYARATDISVCLPTHIQGLCQRQNLDEKIVRLRRSDKRTNWQAKDKIFEKKNFKTIRQKAWKKLEVKMNRRTDKVTYFWNVLHSDMRKSSWCF